jgi:hypothetical protein
MQGALQLQTIDGARAVLIEMLEHASPVLIFFFRSANLPLLRQRRLKYTHLDVSPKSGELVQHPIETHSYDRLPEAGMAYLGKVDVPGLVYVLTRCEDIHALGKNKLHQRAYKEVQ